MDRKLVDVAKLADVSPATVSRVLNNSSLVTKKTAERVLQAIEELNYHPNAAAKHLRSQRTRTIGVIIQDINIAYFAEIIKGIQNTAYALNYKVIVCDSDNKPEKEQDYLGLLKNRTVDALILVSSTLRDELLTELADNGHKIGLIGRSIDHDSIPCCLTDNVKFSTDVIRHFLDQGHRHIAYINGYPEIVDSYERLEGYMKALKERRIPFFPELIECGDFSEEGGYSATKRLLRKNIPFTAVYAANDEMALGVLKACREMGISIPEQLAIVGVDNNRITEYVTPSLSTVNQPKFQLGALLTEKIIAQLGDEPDKGPRIITVESELIVRESSSYVHSSR
ncbi:LacI family transcriptional regulator [Paenibacillus baekrokdamisoli]|uniref:LacI family transcriptional regulator n=1 Tax=Paenibacillus baekrokdamisoli TaxID=1712516 RepID=A0A3G9JNK6_9BACL|nr:LacI family DNA-binding transcriptional regulator [Paenibacillus baekrokdamisoli]MBB3072886.1 LacI family transcriptional regulator [Paenibacillus baekrokdamisoli]BBH24444.1 LacI family transcriptional regulator [Paenibacillus baekrokdamisoli]